jgi:alcohol dehydrogenase
MDDFRYYSPVRVIFGAGSSGKIGEELVGRYRKALLVCGKGPFRGNGVFGRIKAALETSGIEVFEMGDIDSNPRIGSVEEGSALCRKEGIQVIVALGGGSTMDCCKVMAGAALTDIDPRKFLWGEKIPMERSLDTVMIPTFAATGTELNNTAVILDDKALSKSWCEAECMFPKITIVDPEIAAGAPYRLTSWGCMDILSHTFEFYFNGHGEAIFQQRLSEALILSAMACVELLQKNPRDLHARGEIAWISIVAWGGLTKIGRGAPDMACHTCAEVLVPYFDIHHGAALGVFTPRWMRWAAPKRPAVFARFARNVMGVTEADDAKAAVEGVERYIQWLKKVGAPDSFEELAGRKISDDTLREISERVRAENPTVGRLIELDSEDIFGIFKACRSPL